MLHRGAVGVWADCVCWLCCVGGCSDFVSVGGEGVVCAAGRGCFVRDYCVWRLWCCVGGLEELRQLGQRIYFLCNLLHTNDLFQQQGLTYF